MKSQVIEHTQKVWPSGFATTINPAHSAAEQCNRQAVTAAWLLKHPDVTGYIYDADAREMGLDPWLSIVGVDSPRDESKILLETGRTTERVVEPNYEVYVPKRAITLEDAARLALPLLESELEQRETSGNDECADDVRVAVTMLRVALANATNG